MIYHKDGSFYQISQGGLVVEKATGNKWEITDLNEVKVVKGQSTVTIKGDARIRVEGNKIEEIMGDYQQIVHGNSYITAGGEMTLNASDRLQARGGDIRLDANVGTFSYYAEKEIQFEAGVGMYFKSPFMWLEAPSNMNIRANNLNMSAVTDLNIRANGGDLNLYGSADVSIKSNSQLKADANGNISITTVSGSTVFINDNVDMANGGGASATDAVYAEQSISSERVESPEPPAKAMPIRKSQDTASGKPHGDVGSTHGVASGDDQAEGGPGSQTGVNNTVSTSIPTSPISSAVGGMLGPLLDLIGNAESGPGGYDAIWGSQGIPDNSGYIPTGNRAGVSFSDYPDKRLTLMTIQEVLNWQESIDKRYNSEASGRYQFMEDTLRGYNNDNNTPARDSLAEQAGLSLSDKFSPENQDKMATVLLQFAGLNAFLNGSKSLESFGNGIAGIWARVPRISGSGAGTGSYDNDGQNKADPNLGGPLRTILTTLKATYDASI
jgi:muramidase (phage lysozyme)